MISRAHAPAAIFAFITASLFFAPSACTSAKSAGPTTLCTPQAEVYCRCQNFDEGTKICADDGQSFSDCEPCDDEVEPEGGIVTPFDGGTTTDASIDDAAIDAGSKCGNGKIDPGEACDDGNAVPDDGCNMSCVPFGGYPATAGVCPGMPVHVWSAGSNLSFAGTTNLFALTFRAKAACGGSTGSTGSDRVYAVTPHVSGTLTVKATSTTFDVMLYARSDCATQADELACANAVSGAGDETLSFPVQSGSTYAVIVDGATNTTGTFTLSLSLK